MLAPDRRSLAIAGALATAVFLLAWWRHDSFRSEMDLAVYDQAIWKMAHLKWPEVSTIGWNVFADHLSPVLVAFIPLYWLAATPLWLFAAQGVTLGLGYLALRPALEAMGLPRGRFAPFAVAYLASPLLWNAALFEFHPTTLAVPLLLVGLGAAFRDDRRVLVLCALGLLFLRDDLGLAVAAMALVRFWTVPRTSRRVRLALVLGGLGWMALAGALATVLGSDRHWTFHYGYLAASPTDALLHPVRSAWRLVLGVARLDNLTLILLGYLAPLGFMPLLRPARLGLALAITLPLLASGAEQFHSPGFHYGAFVFPFLLAAAASRAEVPLRVWRNPVLLPGCALALLLAIGPFGWRNLAKPTVDRQDARQALALVQSDDYVIATNGFAPHLSHRDDLRIFPFPLAVAEPGFPLPPRARSVSPEEASAVDVVVFHTPLHRSDLPAHDAFGDSPYLDQFPFVSHFGEVTVYRRTPPPP